MKSTGIVRKVDELGRIVLPIEMRRTLDIAERDALEIYVEGSSVILKKYKPSCVFWVCVVCLFMLMWLIQGVTPATLTARRVVRTIVYGPFQCGAMESCL